MNASEFGDRHGPISSLQTARGNVMTGVAPGSDKEAIAERAMDYVLSEDRDDISEEYRLRAAKRNARFAHYRAKRRARSAMTLYRSQSGVAVDAMRDLATSRPGTRVENRVAATLSPSAEDCVMTAHSDLCDCTLQVAAGISPAAKALVGYLMDGYNVTEAAKAAGISRATANRVISRLRAEVPRPAVEGVTT